MSEEELKRFLRENLLIESEVKRGFLKIRLKFRDEDIYIDETLIDLSDLEDKYG